MCTSCQWLYTATPGICSWGCFPYTSGQGVVPSCIAKCVDGSPMQLYHSKNFRAVKGMAAMMEELMARGPLQTWFQGYGDFFSYKRGIYHHVSGPMVGSHTPKVLGWGVEGGVLYWLCQQYWGKEWGEGGYFRIMRGNNECGFEDHGQVADAAP